MQAKYDKLLQHSILLFNKHNGTRRTDSIPPTPFNTKPDPKPQSQTHTPMKAKAHDLSKNPPIYKKQQSGGTNQFSQQVLLH